MKRRIQIQSVTETSDGQGGITEAWATFATVWASIEPLKGYEKMQAMQLASPITHKVIIRYLAGVTTRHRILYDGRVFAIKEVINPSEENDFLNMQCVEG